LFVEPDDPGVVRRVDGRPSCDLAEIRAIVGKFEDGRQVFNADPADQIAELVVFRKFKQLSDDVSGQVIEERPAVVILQRRFAGQDALDLCRTIRLRSASDPTPPAIVVVAARQDEMDVEAGMRAGVTDWLLWPFKETYARTRMQSWVLRESLRWRPAPLPENEEQRLLAVHALHLLDTPPEERFDRYTRIAAELFDVPIAIVSLIDTDRQYYKSHHGIDLSESPRETAFCAHTILDNAVLQVPDALEDDRFADSPFVAGEPRVRFYAGVPLAGADGSLLGAFCVVDKRPRQLDQQQLTLLRDLADLVQAELMTPSAPPAERRAASAA